MIGKYRNIIIITSFVILLPILCGFMMWDKLPEMMPTHWGFDGAADGYSDKLTGIILTPLIFLAAHLFCVWITLKDNKGRAQSEKIMLLIMWIMPVISIFTSFITYSATLGDDFGTERTTPIFIGLMFVIIGNYLPKTRMNSIIGIKIPTTYSSEANWNATHRMSGKLWMAGGLLTMISAAFDEEIMVFVLLAAVILMTAIPMVYSYLFYRREKAEGKDVTTKRALPLTPGMLMFRKIMMAGVAALLIFIVVIMFAGDIEYELNDDHFNIKASFYNDMAVSYDNIDNIEYREDFKTGIRTYGFGSARLSMGTFKNDEFGKYTLYAYTGSDAHIIIQGGEKVLVLSAKTVEETHALYENILERVDK